MQTPCACKLHARKMSLAQPLSQAHFRFRWRESGAEVRHRAPRWRASRRRAGGAQRARPTLLNPTGPDRTQPNRTELSPADSAQARAPRRVRSAPDRKRRHDARGAAPPQPPPSIPARPGAHLLRSARSATWRPSSASGARRSWLRRRAARSGRARACGEHGAARRSRRLDLATDGGGAGERAYIGRGRGPPRRMRSARGVLSRGRGLTSRMRPVGGFLDRGRGLPPRRRRARGFFLGRGRGLPPRPRSAPHKGPLGGSGGAKGEAAGRGGGIRCHGDASLHRA